jgi:hypothetical protein
METSSMFRTNRLARLPLLLAACAAASYLGCAARFEMPDDFDLEPPTARGSGPLGGEALSQRKQQLERAQRDMVHFHTTLESLHHRRDRNGLVLFSGFLDAYMGRHLEPLLDGKWQSTHPELMALDANLRFARAEVLIQMRAPRRVQDVIDGITERYEGRGSMLVEFPIGGQSTLEQALEILSSRKWRG